MPSPDYLRYPTYTWRIWNSYHLYFIFSVIIRVVGKGLCRSPKEGVEKKALCSKASDEYALIQRLSFLLIKEGLVWVELTWPRKRTAT